MARGQYRDRRRYLFTVLAVIISFLAASAVGNETSEPPTLRSYQILDEFRDEDITSLAWSPDGATLAVVRRRAATSQVTNSLLLPETRDDIWMKFLGSGKLINITNGHMDAAGSWDPKWSPDGKKISFLSSRGGLINAWIWEKQSGEIRQLTTIGVDPGAGADGPLHIGGCQWLDNSNLLCLTPLTSGDAQPVGIARFPGRVLIDVREHWERAQAGANTASEVSSLTFELPMRRLVTVSIVTGAIEYIAQLPIEPIGANRSPYWLSPDSRHIAIQRNGISEFPARIRRRIGYVGQVELRATRGGQLAISNQIPIGVILSSLKWSPDGTKLAFFSIGDKRLNADSMYGSGWRPKGYVGAVSKNYPGHLFVLDLTQDTITRLKIDDIDLGQEPVPPDYIWRGSNSILIHATLRSESAPFKRWIQFDLAGQIREVDKRIASASNPIVVTTGETFFLSGGEVWRLDILGRLNPVKRNGRTLRADSLAQCSDKDCGVAAAETAMNREQLYVVGFDSVIALGPFEKNQSEPFVAAGHSSGRNAVVQSERGVVRLKITGAIDTESTIMELNPHRRDSKRFEQRTIKYKSMNGMDLVGLVTFPTDYDVSRRYPTIVDSDIGYGPVSAPFLYRVERDRLPSPDAAAFTAAGYVYVFLSMPTQELNDVGRGDLLSFTSGILPGVEALVNLGITDPNRVFLYGVSSMGYGVLGLTTQTARFKAAVCAFGFADPAARSLSTPVRARYSPSAFDWVNSDVSYLQNVSHPPFANAGIYERNNVMRYTDRISTPLLIIAGELDSDLMANVEPLFGSLVLQRKPASFVRYWGEGHGMQTPENRLDYYARIFAWFDRWGGIVRDGRGRIVFSGSVARSRGNTRILSPEEYRQFPFFGGSHGTANAP